MSMKAAGFYETHCVVCGAEVGTGAWVIYKTVATPDFVKPKETFEWYVCEDCRNGFSVDFSRWGSLSGAAKEFVEFRRELKPFLMDFEGIESGPMPFAGPDQPTPPNLDK